MATNQKVNFEVSYTSWFKTKKVTIKGEKVEVPTEWEKVLIGIYPSYEEGVFILRRAQGIYRKTMIKDGKKPIARFFIRKTASAVTTRSVSNYLQSISEVY